MGRCSGRQEYRGEKVSVGGAGEGAEGDTMFVGNNFNNGWECRKEKQGSTAQCRKNVATMYISMDVAL
jgi:hypothetical protein